jgi:hypothetical protein
MNILGQKITDSNDSTFYGQIELEGPTAELRLKGVAISETLDEQKNIDIDQSTRIGILELEVLELKTLTNELKSILEALRT